MRHSGLITATVALAVLICASVYLCCGTHCAQPSAVVTPAPAASATSSARAPRSHEAQSSTVAQRLFPEPKRSDGAAAAEAGSAVRAVAHMSNRLNPIDAERRRELAATTLDSAQRALVDRKLGVLQMLRAALRLRASEQILPAEDVSALDLGTGCVAGDPDAAARAEAFLREHQTRLRAELKDACEKR